MGLHIGPRSAFSLGLNAALRRGGVPRILRRQLVATFCGEPNLAPTLMAAGGSYDTNNLRNGHYVGRSDVYDLMIHDEQIRMNTGGGVEVGSPAATQRMRRALEINGVTYPATYDGGAIYKDCLTGGRIATDVIAGAAATAGSQIITRGSRTVFNATTGVFTPASDFINGINMVGPLSQGFRTIGNAQVNGVGTMNASGSGGGNALWPRMVSGFASIPMAACWVIGDSLTQYLADLNTATAGGFAKRALNNVNGEVIPWMISALDGAKMQNMVPLLAPLTWSYISYVTFVMLCTITNDVAANRTIEQIKADFIAIATKVKTTIGPYGLPVLMVACCCLNRGTFTGAQNVVKNAYNDWILAGADGYCDVAFDGRPYQGDVNTYPNDTIHLGPTNHADVAAPLAETLEPLLDPMWQPDGYVRMAA
ncbi:hypothetical protein ACC862_24055 [Rhizobium ruizarguesonis]